MNYVRFPVSGGELYFKTTIDESGKRDDSGENKEDRQVVILDHADCMTGEVMIPDSLAGQGSFSGLRKT